MLISAQIDYLSATTNIPGSLLDFVHIEYLPVFDGHCLRDCIRGVYSDDFSVGEEQVCVRGCCLNVGTIFQDSESGQAGDLQEIWSVYPTGWIDSHRILPLFIEQ